MKIDGKAIAQEMLKKKKEEVPADEGEKVEESTEGDPVEHMSKFIDAIHGKDPKMAHEMMTKALKATMVKKESEKSEEY